MNKSTPIFYQAGEELLSMRSLAKRRKKQLTECLEAIAMYQSIVQDQEIKLMDLQVEACLRANDFREIQRQLKDLRETIEVLEDLLGD